LDKGTGGVKMGGGDGVDGNHHDAPGRDDADMGCPEKTALMPILALP